MPNLDTLYLLLIVLHSMHSYEYCKNEAKLCDGQKNVHIMCNPNQLAPTSVYQMHYIMTQKFRDIIIYWHNYYRNQVACGNVTGEGGAKLPTAKQMRELVWDYELEYLAYTHAARCNKKNDMCRNTLRMPKVGQNLSKKGINDVPYPPIKRAYDSIVKWFGEHANVPVDVIKEYQPTAESTGRFTLMINDSVGRMGCAMVWGTSFANVTDKTNDTFLTCNYDGANLISLPLYLDGKPASNCGVYGYYGKSSNFSCLCAKTFRQSNSSFLFF